jgi:hypothetical protein
LVRCDPVDNICDFQFFTLVVSIPRVTVGTSEVTPGEPYKNTRPAGKGRLALNAVKDLVDL